ncbi:scavenger receptor cysteine-rich type 1 protein M130-like isoform 2-T2 [Syngnathus typhle]
MSTRFLRSESMRTLIWKYLRGGLTISAGYLRHRLLIMRSICDKLRPCLAIGILFICTVCASGTVRLAGPTSTSCSGRVEVFHGGAWGTVCADFWNLTNAHVVCREMGCGSALSVSKAELDFGHATGQIWLDDVQCTGKELSLLKCPHRPFGENDCLHGGDVAVVCSEHVRVSDGSDHCNGRVEVFFDGRWSKVCAELGPPEAKVLCQEINCGKPRTSGQKPHYGQSRETSAVKSTCSGNETSFSQCSHKAVNEQCPDAGVSCQYSEHLLRLVNGSHRCAGRVELLHQGRWGPVCDDKWDMAEATVTCRQMGCGAPLAVKDKAFFGTTAGNIWLDDLECTGQEKSLSECPHLGFGHHDCSPDEGAGVICSETLRLSNSSRRCSGRLEVFHHGEWGKLCHRDLGAKEVAMLCRELNCGGPSKSQEYFGESPLRSYRGSCGKDATSFSQCSVRESAEACRGFSLSCEDPPTLRFVNGTDRCSGRVEIQHRSAWGTVCDDHWDIRDAQVACRAMDCGTAITAKSGAYFGRGTGSVWLDDVACIGNESSLTDCETNSPLGLSNCHHDEDAGVVCSATIRLINGSNQCSGRVEFHHQGHWWPVFNVQWGLHEAVVVCREMNCGDPVEYAGSFGQSGEHSGYTISCSGREKSLEQCSLRESVRNVQNQEASVRCSGNVRLAGGVHRCAGRVEFYDQGRWGDVCGETWDTSDAQVVCKQLDCGKALNITTAAEYGRGSGHVWMMQKECSGTESTLAQCPESSLLDGSCNTTSLAGVICSESLEVRLVHSERECTGRVEVQHDGAWYSLCDTHWDLAKADLVCDRLECGRVVSVHGAAHYGQGSGAVMEASDGCFANSTSLQQCSLKGFARSTCQHDRDVGVSCGEKVQLVGGWSSCSGRLEVFHAGRWGTVCDDEWELSAADVVCRQLGCGHAVSAPSNAHFGRGSGPIWLDDVVCGGQELAITHCNHLGFGDNNCGHSEDAGVICLGALSKPRIAVSPSSQVHWGENVEFTCTILTEHQGGTFLLKKLQDSFKLQKYSENEAATFSLSRVNSSHQGSYFCEYQKKVPANIIYFPQGDPVELDVKVELEKPQISMTTFQVMVVYSPREMSVTRGSSFSVTCSVHSLYSRGTFYLKNTDTNVTSAKAAFGRTLFYVAVFEFPDIEDEDRGAYVCLYAVNFSSNAFWSTPSTSLYINVVAASSSSLVPGIVSGLLLLLLVVTVGYLLWRRRRQHAGPSIRFGAMKSASEDTSDRRFEGRHRSEVSAQGPPPPPPADKAAEVDSDSSRQTVPDDLPGRMCYELDPLVSS